MVLACRNLAKATSARGELVARTGRSSVVVRHLDLADQASVAAFAAETSETDVRFDLLVNDAV